MNYVNFTCLSLAAVNFVGIILALRALRRQSEVEKMVHDSTHAEHYKIKVQLKLLEDKMQNFEKWAQEVNHNHSDSASNIMLSLITFYKKKTGKILFAKKEMKQMFGDDKK